MSVLAVLFRNPDGRRRHAVCIRFRATLAIAVGAALLTSVDSRGGTRHAARTVTPNAGSNVVARQFGFGYAPGKTNHLSCAFEWPTNRTLLSLKWTPEFPAGWTLTGASGDGEPEVTNAVEIVFVGDLTNHALAFAYAVGIPAETEGTQTVSGVAEYHLGGDANPSSVRADPDPLVLDSHHTIQARAGTNAWISPSGAVTVAHGAGTSFVMAAEAYYHVSDVQVDEVSIGPADAYTFENVDRDRRIEVFAAENLACRGTPEWWLAGYGLTNETQGFCEAETNDVDGDGATAWEEWTADTDPTNAHSVLAIVNIAPTNGHVRLQWSGGRNAHQSLEIRTNLTEEALLWMELFTNEPPTPATGTYLHTNAPHPTLFYRMKAWR